MTKWWRFEVLSFWPEAIHELQVLGGGRSLPARSARLHRLGAAEVPADRRILHKEARGQGVAHDVVAERVRRAGREQAPATRLQRRDGLQAGPRSNNGRRPVWSDNNSLRH